MWPLFNDCSASLAASVKSTNSSCHFKVIVADVLNARIGGVAVFLLKGLGGFSFRVVVEALRPNGMYSDASCSSKMLELI